jgi:hypothetical protein
MRHLVLIFFLLALATPTPAAGYDEHTLTGMDAYTAGEWLAAVRAFAKAAEAAPEEDPLPAKRLAEAKKRAVEFWSVAADTCTKNEAWTGARMAVLVLRKLQPGCRALKQAETALAKAGRAVPTEEGAPGTAVPDGALEGRARLAVEHGKAYDEAAALVDGLLRWLAFAQEKDGLYNCKKHGGYVAFDEGITGLAVIAMLGEGKSALTGPRGDTIRRAVNALVKGQGKDGHFGRASAFHYTYCHAISTEAIARYAVAAGETGKLKPVLENAAGFIFQRHNPGAGWRYGNRMGDSDTSVTFWMVSALDALAKAGIRVRPECLEGARALAEHVTRDDDGRAGYMEEGTGSAREEKFLDIYPYTATRAMTAACAMIRYLTGDRSSKALSLQLKQIREIQPLKAVPDMYYWHIGARAFMSADSGIPRDWYRKLVDACKHHRGLDGSMDPADVWGKDGGRVYATAITAMALMAPMTEAKVGGLPSAASQFVKDGSWSGTVPPSARPIPTGLYLDEGMKVTADPKGSILYWPGHDPADPGGAKKVPAGRKKINRSAKYGCLLGQIGEDGRPFPIRRKGPIRFRGCGQLYLLVNDTKPSGAKGEFEVKLTLAK